MLWPLGGVAYVNPPQRPGATLWSIAAGPLVNVACARFCRPLSLQGQIRIGILQTLMYINYWLRS